MRDCEQEAHARRKSPIRQNIDEIRCLEEQTLKARTLSEKFGDWVAQESGTMKFVWLNAIWYAGWIVLNVNLVPGLKPFDPFPFTFLTLCVSLEAIFLSIFVLMSQNRMSLQSDLRTHLDLQINLLNEAEATQILRCVRALCHKLEIEVPDEDDHAEELEKPTPVKDMFEDLKERLPQDFGRSHKRAQP